MTPEQQAIIVADTLRRRVEQLEAERDQQAAEIERLRKILAHVPNRIAMKAKEDAGYGVAIRTMQQPEKGTP